MRLGRLALLIACALVFAGHLCALPFAPVFPAPAAAGSHADGHEGLHAASCEAVAVAPASSPGAALAAVPLVVAAEPPAGHAGQAVVAPPVPERPPRYLLHAALLI